MLLWRQSHGVRNDDSEDDCITEFEALEDSDAFEEGPSVSLHVNRSTHTHVQVGLYNLLLLYFAYFTLDPTIPT